MAGNSLRPPSPDPRQPTGPDPRGLPDVDQAVPHIARIQNYWRGGKDYFPADKEAAEQAMAAYPNLAHSVRANRAFLARAVRYLVAEAGVRQFLDIGTGLPAAGSVHEVARAVDPRCRVVYVDNDPVVCAHARALLEGGRPGLTAYLNADVRQPGPLLERAADTLDFARPVGVLLVSVLHMIDDHHDPRGIVAALMDAAVPGSHLVLTHVASDIEPEAMAEVARRINQRVAQRVTHRDHARVSSFFGDLELLPPGVVKVPEWRPESAAASAAPSGQWGGVAVLRARLPA